MGDRCMRLCICWGCRGEVWAIAFLDQGQPVIPLSLWLEQIQSRLGFEKRHNELIYLQFPALLCRVDVFCCGQVDIT